MAGEAASRICYVDAQAVMAVEQGEASGLAKLQMQYSLTEMLELRHHASSNMSLEETGITIEPATRMVFCIPGQPLGASAESRAQRPRGQAHHPLHRLPPGKHQTGKGSRGQGRWGPSPPPVLLSAREEEEEEEWGDAEEDSEDENPQYRALYVSGEPDFSIEEPDAEEYLRRVRWEARRCPRVVVAPTRSAVPAPQEQTPYMPHLPDVAPCAPTLLPSTQWETRFLADFSDLRTELVCLSSLVDNAGADALSCLPSAALPVPPLREAGAWKRFCVGPIPSNGAGEAGSVPSPEGGSPQTGSTGVAPVEGGSAEGRGGQEAGSAGPTTVQAGDEEVGGDHACVLNEEGPNGVGTPVSGQQERPAAEAPDPPVHGGSVMGALTETGEQAAGPAGGGPDATEAAVGEAALDGPSYLSDGDAQASTEAKAGAAPVAEDACGVAPGVGGEREASAAGPVARHRPRRREALPEGVLPLLGILLQFDQVALAVHLRHHVRWLHELPLSAPLERGRASWLFALCSLVGKPLDADTQAALRDLLRAAAARRASKVSADDPELPMLSVLVSIAGRYFGQQER